MKPIHDQIMDAQKVSGELRDAWVDQLAMIDKVSGRVAGLPTGVEKAEKLAEGFAISLRD